MKDDRPWMGVYAKPLIDYPFGPDGLPLVITKVEPGSLTSDKLLPDDLITAVDGNAASSSGVAFDLEQKTAGSTVNLTVLRGQQQRLVAVQLGSVADSSAQAVGASSWYVLALD